MSYNQGYGNQYQQQQQQVNLPVNPTAIMNQPIAVQPGAPHMVPSVNVNPRIHQSLPLITSIVIMEIQNKMQQNNLRTFMYNLYSLNQYNNREFAELVEICANCVDMTMMNSREFNTVDAAIFQIVPNVVTMMAGAQIRPFPDLAKFLDQTLLNNAVNGARALGNLVRDISNWVNPQQQNQGYGNQGYGNQGGQFANFPTGGQQNNFNYGGGRNITTMAAMGGETGSHGLFGNNQPTNTGYPQAGNGPATATTTGSANRFRKQLSEQHNAAQVQQHVHHGYQIPDNSQGYGNRDVSAPAPSHRATAADMLSADGAVKQPFKSRDPAILDEATMSAAPTPTYDRTPQVMETQPSRWLADVEAPKAGQSIETTEEATLYPEEHLPRGIKWKRSDTQPYHPAWNPRKQKPMYAVLPNGTVLAVLVNLSESEKSMMEYDKHAIGVRPTAPAVTPGKEQAEVVDRELDPANVSVSIDDTTTLVDCEETAAIHSLLKTKLGSKVEGVDGYTMKMAVASPIICDTPELAQRYRSLLADASVQRSFADLAKLIKGMTDESELQLREYLNTILTKEVNSVLELEMGLVQVVIDSFVDDVVVLEKMIRTKYGNAVADALKNRETKIVDRCISVMGTDEAKDYSSSSVGDLEGFDNWSGEIVYNLKLYTYTHIKAKAYQLELAGPEGTTVMVSEESNAVLHAILKQVLSDVSDVNRNYLVTSDGVKFEAAHGYLNKETILVRQARSH